METAIAQFVILRHEGPRGLHWDLLLERGPAMRTWALPQPPEPGVEMICRALPDHRLVYLDYEGPLSGDRGRVTRWDRGTYEIEAQDDARLVVRLSGEKCAGRVTLERLADDPQSWRLSVLCTF